MPPTEHATFRVTVTTLTPLHIGTENKLFKEYDYAVFNGRTWRINENELLDAQKIDDPDIVDMLAETPPAQLLSAQDFVPGSKFFRYTIPGTPRSTIPGASLREQIKDVYDRPYLPGTSLKGALRTALGWYFWNQNNLAPQPNDLGFRREFAARHIEQTLFGRDPNHDLLRALQVADSRPLAPDRLAILNAGVVNRGGMAKKSIPIELEAIRPESVFELDIKLDLALYSGWARDHGLDLKGLDALLALPQVVQTRSLARIRQEIEWFSGQAGFKRLYDFYSKLSGLRLEPSQCLLQMGWGTGWDGMTFGSMVTRKPNFLAHVLRTYRMTRGNFQPGDPFPKSRRIMLLTSKQPDGRWVSEPARPMGWVLLTFSPLHQPGGEWPAAIDAARKRLTPPATAAPAVPATAAPTPPAPRPLIASFTDLPKPGDRFQGTVLESESNGKVTLEIPGLDMDTQAWAVVSPAENPTKKVYKDRVRLRLEVLSVSRDSKGYATVFCREG